MKKKIALFLSVLSVVMMLGACGTQDPTTVDYNGRSYDDLYKESVELGTALANIGMHDKHIAIIGENSYKWLTTYLTVLQSTGVFVPIDKELTVKEIQNIGKQRFCPGTKQGHRQKIHPADYLHKSNYHRQNIGIAQGRTHHIHTGRNTVRQKGICQFFSGIKGIFRRKGPLNGQTGNKPQMHIHIPVSTLSGTECSRFVHGYGMGV